MWRLLGLYWNLGNKDVIKVFCYILILFLRYRREFVEKRVTFEASGFMVYWSLPCNRAYVERKMY